MIVGACIRDAVGHKVEGLTDVIAEIVVVEVKEVGTAVDIVLGTK